MKKIEKGCISRPSTYVKRRAGLFKKARELAILCGCDLAVILISREGEVAHQCSTDLMEVIARYKEWMARHSPEGEGYQEKQEPNLQIDHPRHDTQQHDLKKMQNLGKNLIGMDLQALYLLEQKLNEGLLRVKDRKEQILLGEIAECRKQEEKAKWQIQNLNRQAESYRTVIRSLCPMPVSQVYPGTTSNVQSGEEESITALTLG